MKGISTSGKLLSVAATAGLLLTACGTTGGSSDNAGSSGGCTKYTIAFMGAETGPAGALGQNMAGGVNLAVDEYNADHPDCKVAVKDYDSQGDATKATALAQNIVKDQSVLGLVGPGFSGESLSTGKTFDGAQLPSISPSATNVTITEQGWTFWHRVIGNDNAQGEADAKFLSGKSKKIFVIDDGTDYGKGLGTVVRNALPKGTLVGNDQVDGTNHQTDFSATVTKVKGSGADALFFGGYYPEAGLLVKQLRAAGWKGLFMSGDGSEDPAFVKTAGAAAAEGSYLSAPAGPAPADFSQKFAKSNGGNPAGLYSTQAYDAANIFLAGLEAGKTSHTDMNEFIDSYTGDGVSGPIAFDDKGDIKSTTIYAYPVKGGKIDTDNPLAIK